jgi:hypothetical protein
VEASSHANQLNNITLPAELKNFLQMSNGIDLCWTVDQAGALRKRAGRHEFGFRKHLLTTRQARRAWWATCTCILATSSQ